MALAADLAEQAAQQRRQQEVAAVLAALERSHGIGASHGCPLLVPLSTAQGAFPDTSVRKAAHNPGLLAPCLLCGR